MLPEHVHIAVKDAIVFAAQGELVEGLPNTELQHGERLEVHVGMAHALGVNPATAGTHLDMARVIGHDDEEATEGPLAGGQGRELRQPGREKGMRPGTQRNAELGHQIEEPLQGNPPPERIIHMAQGLEAQRRTPEIVPGAAEQIGEQAGVAVQVKHLGLRACDTASTVPAGNCRRCFCRPPWRRG